MASSPCGALPGLLERAEEISRTRARLVRGESLADLAPRLRRATPIARQLPRSLREAIERDAALVRTGISTAAEYGWDDLVAAEHVSWRLDAYLSQQAFSALQEQLNRLDVNGRGLRKLSPGAK